MGTSMLDYYKMILDKVSFDAALFKKELRKAIGNLVAPDAEALLSWCIGRYRYP
jgi:hypothetical protein